MRTKHRVAEALIDRFLKETDPTDPQQIPKKDPMIDMPGTPGDQGTTAPFVPDTDGEPEYDPMGLGWGKIGS